MPQTQEDWAANGSNGSLATNSASRAMSHMPLFATEIADIDAEHFRSALLLLDVNLLCNGDGVVYLDA